MKKITVGVECSRREQGNLVPMEEELGGSLWDGITDSQVRLYVYFG